MRAGESADDVAAATGWDVAKVLRYAEPLLAERAFIAQQATRVEVRRSGGGATLLDTVTVALGAEAEDVAWDAHRRDDGRWVVTATVPDGTRASWTYDHQGRNLHALDDHARMLMGVSPPPPAEPDVDIAAALDLAGDVPVVREDAARPHLVAVPSAGETHGDDEASAAADEAEHPVARQYEQETITLPRDSAEPAPDSEHESAAENNGPETRSTAPKKSARKARGRKGRASVPSWDEILFGAGRTDD